MPPWDLVPYANCGGTDFVHDIVHIAQTGPQGHFSVGPQRGRGLSPLVSMFILYFVSLVKIIFTFCSTAFEFNCLGVAH